MKRRQLLASIPFIASGTIIDRIAMAALPLRVGAALPDPPFEFVTGNGPASFDVALMQRVAERLGRQWQLVPYEGRDFNRIFAGLNEGTYDCVASGTTITPERERIVDFCAPYVISDQFLVVDPNRHPNVHRIDNLQGLVIDVQEGNTSQPVANRLVAEHRAACTARGWWDTWLEPRRPWPRVDAARFGGPQVAGSPCRAMSQVAL